MAHWSRPLVMPELDRAACDLDHPAHELDRAAYDVAVTETAELRATDLAELRVADNPDARRYEAHLGNELAGYSEYLIKAERVVFFHTVVEPRFEGGGIGSRLVRYELDDVRARGLKVTPRCPFVRAFIRRHPEYADLVA